MSKNKKIIKKEKSVSVQKEIMTKILSGEISMKPKWYFVVGSVVGWLSLVGISIGLIYLTNLTFFLLRKHGPMGQWRLEAIIENFPWWIIPLGMLGVLVSVWLLKKYDYSYKKNFPLIIFGFVLSIVVAAFVVDKTGLNEAWFQRGAMRKFYQQIENKNVYPGRVNGIQQINSRGKRNF